MNREKILLGVGVTVAVLALCLTAFASLHVACEPKHCGNHCIGKHGNFRRLLQLHVYPHWSLIESNSSVGTINNTTGPQTTFTVGTSPSTAYVFAST